MANQEYPFKRRVAADVLQVQKEMKEEIWQISAEENQRRSTEYWAKVTAKARDLIQSGAQSYNDWKASIMEIIASLEDLAYALHYTFNGIGDRLRQHAFIREKVIPLIDSLKDELSSVNLPKLQYSLYVDKAGNLQSTVTGDGKPLTAEAKSLFDQTAFDQATALLLKLGTCNIVDEHDENGYPVKHLVDKRTNQSFTQQDFEAIINDPKHELHKLLEQELGVSLETIPEAPSSPTPTV